VDLARQYGVERFAADLLPVADSTLSLALESARSADAATLAQGQEATAIAFARPSSARDSHPSTPAASRSIPALHESHGHARPPHDHPPHTVLPVVQQGWLLNGRLLRPGPRHRLEAAPEPENPGSGHESG
jgi:molecular chaperone GrpE